jgi:hypothetical protein
MGGIPQGSKGGCVEALALRRNIAANWGYCQFQPFRPPRDPAFVPPPFEYQPQDSLTFLAF